MHGRTTTERNTNQTSLPSPSVDQRPSLVENEEKRTPASYVHCLESNAALKGIRALYDNKYECVCVGEHRKAMRTCVVTGVWICSFSRSFPSLNSQHLLMRVFVVFVGDAVLVFVGWLVCRRKSQKDKINDEPDDSYDRLKYEIRTEHW